MSLGSTRLELGCRTHAQKAPSKIHRCFTTMERGRPTCLYRSGQTAAVLTRRALHPTRPPCDLLLAAAGEAGLLLLRLAAMSALLLAAGCCAAFSALLLAAGESRSFAAGSARFLLLPAALAALSALLLAAPLAAFFFCRRWLQCLRCYLLLVRCLLLRLLRWLRHAVCTRQIPTFV